MLDEMLLLDCTPSDYLEYTFVKPFSSICIQLSYPTICLLHFSIVPGRMRSINQGSFFVMGVWNNLTTFMKRKHKIVACQDRPTEVQWTSRSGWVRLRFLFCRLLCSEISGYGSWQNDLFSVFSNNLHDSVYALGKIGISNESGTSRTEHCSVASSL